MGNASGREATGARRGSGAGVGDGPAAAAASARTKGTSSASSSKASSPQRDTAQGGGGSGSSSGTRTAGSGSGRPSMSSAGTDSDSAVQFDRSASSPGPADEVGARNHHPPPHRPHQAARAPRDRGARREGEGGGDGRRVVGRASVCITQDWRRRACRRIAGAALSLLHQLQRSTLPAPRSPLAHSSHPHPQQHIAAARGRPGCHLRVPHRGPAAAGRAVRRRPTAQRPRQVCPW